MAERSNRLLFLGTGTSTGVPVIGCQCHVCTSTNPHDTRSRVSALLKTRPSDTAAWEYTLLDTSIDLRQQLAMAGAPLVATVVYTHAHVDHFFGLDELRVVQYRLDKPIDIYCSEEVKERLHAVYSHLFDPHVQQGGGILSIRVHPTSERFSTGAMDLAVLPVYHGSQPVQGYRWGDLAYITDCSFIPESTWPLLEGLDTLVLDALRKRPHETHFCLAEALEVVERLQPRRTYFIHMTHDLLHEETNAELPEGVELAYDGLEIDLPPFDPVEWGLPHRMDG